MKLNEKRIELLKNTEVIIHNQNFRKDSGLLNQIISNALDCDICFDGTTNYYGIKKIGPNNYDWDTSDNIDGLMIYLKKPTSKNILIKPISWFFEEENNNILILI
jgi:hypothetical protein